MFLISCMERFTSHRFEFAGNGWRIINVFDCSCYCEKNKYKSIVDLDSSLPLKWSFHSKCYIFYRRVSSGYFPRFSTKPRLRMLLLQETFGFKWRNESMLSSSEKEKEREINGKHGLLRVSRSIFGIEIRKISIPRIMINKRRLCDPAVNTMLSRRWIWRGSCPLQNTHVHGFT